MPLAPRPDSREISDDRFSSALASRSLTGPLTEARELTDPLPEAIDHRFSDALASSAPARGVRPPAPPFLLPAPVAPSLLLPLGRGVERRRRHLGRRGLLLLLLELHARAQAPAHTTAPGNDVLLRGGAAESGAKVTGASSADAADDRQARAAGIDVSASAGDPAAAAPGPRRGGRERRRDRRDRRRGRGNGGEGDEAAADSVLLRKVVTAAVRRRRAREQRQPLLLLRQRNPA